MSQLKEIIKNIGNERSYGQIEQILIGIIEQLHMTGPIDQHLLEQLSYIKKYFSGIFAIYENKILFLLGLFYKTENPTSLLEKVYSIYGNAIKDKTSFDFTPVQASAYNKILEHKFFSFSAPTSTGKSYLFRSLIEKCIGDIIIVVPSRALIAEYMIKTLEIVGKDVLVLQFIESVNEAHTNRRIFIITPERGIELFKNIDKLNVELFLFDEAQISEEYVRGMRFDALVRRINRTFPNAKKVFAHPFIENPGAQLLKHDVNDDKANSTYKQNTVGKIYLYTNEQKDSFKFFSPFDNKIKPLKKEIPGDIVEYLLSRGGTLLVYISKSKIYSGQHLVEFRKYINLCPKIVEPEALSIIEELRNFIGANKDDSNKHSVMIDMMERGIVIHHGSIPLMGRFLIEKFVNKGFARICFSTSTLMQGINMPIDIVWIDNFMFTGTLEARKLAVKNLIGRAGRNLINLREFDYGFVVIKEGNVSLFNQRINEGINIKETSGLDEDIQEVDEDLKDIVEAIRNNSFDDVLQLTQEQVKRISEANLSDNIGFILDKLLPDGRPLTGNEYNNLDDIIREEIKNNFKTLYVSHLRRNQLTPAETLVLSAAIPIILWHIQGRSFSQIISLRYMYVANLDEQRRINAEEKNGNITHEEAINRMSQIPLKYSQLASQLPNKNAPKISIFKPDSKLPDFIYDILVYDTYDYIDKVISFSLVEPLCAAFKIHHDKTGDERAITLSNYIQYGTNDDKEIWLQKYGFSFEDIDWIKPYVLEISAREIRFARSIMSVIPSQFEKVERYIY